jgi:hypothetical protein
MVNVDAEMEADQRRCAIAAVREVPAASSIVGGRALRAASSEVRPWLRLGRDDLW